MIKMFAKWFLSVVEYKVLDNIRKAFKLNNIRESLNLLKKLKVGKKPKRQTGRLFDSQSTGNAGKPPPVKYVKGVVFVPMIIINVVEMF